jgi:uncharacterized membrane protein
MDRVRNGGPPGMPDGITSANRNSPDMQPREGTCSAIRRNIEAVRKLEAEFNENRTLSDRIADGIGGFTGSFSFVVIHAIWVGAWLLWNSAAPQDWRWDPFPFILLCMIVSTESIFLSTFVLMKQNRMAKREDMRAHLDLQINLLSEREMTLVLQLLQRISTRLGVRLSGEEIGELSEETSVEALATELRESLPEE